MSGLNRRQLLGAAGLGLASLPLAASSAAAAPSVGTPATEIVGAWSDELADWNRRRGAYLLYTEDH